MGVVTKHRKNYVSHKKRWNKKTILDEMILVKDYALKNKKEIRKAELLISKFKRIAKEFNSNISSVDDAYINAFIESMKAKGFLKPDSTSIDEVLDIELREVLERRLSNIVYKNKFAKTPVQARQFVVHKHILVGGKVVDSPSYLVPLALEPTIEFRETSSLFDENHPERKLAEVGMVEVEEMEKIPLAENGVTSDEIEAKLDDEEIKEVAE